MTRVFDIRGTNGSGKSHVVHELMRRNPAVEQFENDSGQIVVNKLVIDDKPVFIVGDYERVCGGCDGIKTQDEIQGLVEEFALEGDVVLEGLLVSHTFERWFKLSEKLKAVGIPYYFMFLDTPMNVCIDRVKARRLARGNDDPYDPKNLIKDWHQNRRVKEKLEAVRANTSWLAYQTAPFAVENLIRGIAAS